MSDAQWICVRQRAGPLTKECRALRPRLSKYDSREDRQEKNEILRSQHTAVDRTSVDHLELRLALFGFEGTHYTLTYDDYLLRRPPIVALVHGARQAVAQGTV